MRRLAERAQLRPTYLSHIVCGRRGLSWEMAERIAAAVPDRWRSWVVRGLNRSPLEALLAAAG